MSTHDQLVDTSTKGLACVCFRNKDRLSMEEIMRMFSEHGDVVSINCAGNEEGYRFVRFRRKEEALKCAIAFDGHRSIRLQPVRPKSKEFDDNYEHEQFTKKKRNNINVQKNDQVPHDERTDKANSMSGSQSSRKFGANNYQRKNTDDQVQNGFNDINNLNNRNGEIGQEHLNTQEYVENDQNPIRKNMNFRSGKKFSKTNESDHKRDEIPNPNNRMNAAKLAQLHKLRGTIANTFQVPSNDLTTNGPAVSIPSQKIHSPLPSNHSSRGQSVMTDMPPPLIAGVSSLHSGQVNVPEEKIKVIPACDVILANIHSNIGISNIYEMLKRFSPIYVSDIETVPEINIRFCYVYFETPNDAIGVEQSFDGVPICGQNLITMRSHRLEVESGIF